jgi:hypothetical protein
VSHIQMTTRSKTGTDELQSIAHEAMLQRELLPDFSADVIAETSKAAQAMKRIRHAHGALDSRACAVPVRRRSGFRAWPITGRDCRGAGGDDASYRPLANNAPLTRYYDLGPTRRESAAISNRGVVLMAAFRRIEQFPGLSWQGLEAEVGIEPDVLS